MNDKEKAEYYIYINGGTEGVMAKLKQNFELASTYKDSSMDNGQMKQAIWALGEIGDKRAIDLILETFNIGPTSSNTRNSAAEALGKIGASAAFAPLLNFLKKSRKMYHVNDALAFLNALTEILKKDSSGIQEESLVEASDQEDVQVIISQKTVGWTGDRYIYDPAYDVKENVSFSTLRQAALQELDHRHNRTNAS